MIIPKLVLSLVFFISVFCVKIAGKKVIHYVNSLATTSAPATESYHNEEFFIKDPPTPRCPFETQPLSGTQEDTVGSNDILEGNKHKQVAGGHHNNRHHMKWQLMASPIKIEEDPFSLIKNGGHEDSNHDDALELNIDDKKDFGYELVNHRFGQSDEQYHGNKDKDNGDQQIDHLNNQRNDLNDNWWTWRNTISYFPSGQTHLKRQHWRANEHAIGHRNRHKPHFWFDKPANKHHPGSSAFQRPISNEIGASLSSSPAANSGQRVEKNVTGTTSSNQLQLDDGVKSDSMNEVDQQDQLHLRGPLMMPIDDRSINVNQQEQQQTGSRSLLVPSSNEQRVRDSLLKAADIARHLTSSSSSATQAPGSAPARAEVSTEPSLVRSNEPSLVSGTRGGDYDSEVSGRSSGTSDSSDSERQFWPSSDQANGFDFPISAQNTTRQPEVPPRTAWQVENNSSPSASSLDPIYLGFGQVQKNSPIAGNGRTQVRLSCQFGEGSSNANMSISSVEWAKFTGNYNLYEDGPSFQCMPQNICSVEPVKTDAITTVHPRPAVQNYIMTMAPSYSVTLHEVDDRHLGVYRCSAIRRIDDREELVYRILSLE